jgi:GNAT superfamily N-acetyltransferase
VPPVSGDGGAPPRNGIITRPATPADAASIRAVAISAWRATYAGLISEGTIERFLARAYAEERVALRIERNDMFVAGTSEGVIEAFAECANRDDHVQLVSFYALPAARGRGLGTALLAMVLEAHPGQDVAADVLVGNDLAEPFYAARGFVPGELLVEELAGEPIRERRWWLRAGA